MPHPALPAIDRAIAALTYDQVERFDPAWQPVPGTVPLLARSIAHDLVQIERVIGATGKTLLGAIAASLDEALLALAEARLALGGEAA